MGCREFQEAVRLYLNRWEFNYAETSNFIRCVYDVAGKPFNWFFDEWIGHGGEPWYKVSYTVTDDTNGNRSTNFKVLQIQETNNLVGYFKMPIRFEVHYKDGSKDSITTWIENQFHEISIANPLKKQISFVLFDPGRQVLKKVTFERSFGELAEQAKKAKNMIDRYDALVEMRNVPCHPEEKHTHDLLQP